MTGSPPLLLVAHGSRDPRGAHEISRIAEALADRLGRDAVHTAYVDVIGPTVAEALDGIAGPVVVVPAFLASGYHVRTDLPEQIAQTGRGGDVVVSEALGPGPELAEAMVDRLIMAGWRPGHRVLFSAAGSSDAGALSDVHIAAELLARLCRQPLAPSFVATAQPLTAELCASPVDAYIAPYLLAPGLFHSKLGELPVTAVADPIGPHPRVIDLILRRYRACTRDLVLR